MTRAQGMTWLSLFALIILHIATWYTVRDVKARWNNVPPVPSRMGAGLGTMGDLQLAYRTYGLMLQNLGSTGGRSESLISYDYNRLKDWLLLTWQLDNRSNYVPYLAAFYFSAVPNPEKLKPLVDYLETAGQAPEGEKWRWLAQAVYLARYQIKDMDRALELANKLAESPDPTLPAWAKQMPAFVQSARGDKQAAYEIMLNVLKTEGDKMPIQEVNFMIDYICRRVLEEPQAKNNPVCAEIKW